jgi:hypothetical protein
MSNSVGWVPDLDGRRVSRVKLLIALMALILAGILAQATPAKASGTSRTIPLDAVYSFRLQNPCTGEFVSGTTHSSGRLIATFLPNGGYRATLIQVGYSEGVGETTGIVYSGPNTSYQSYLEGGSGGAVTNDSGGVSLLVSQGNDPNITLHYTYHLTISANGEVTSSMDNFTLECRG